LLLAFLSIGCAPRIPAGSPPAAWWPPAPESLFVSPLLPDGEVDHPGAGRLLVDPDFPRSGGSPGQYIRLWKQTLYQRGARAGLRVLHPRLPDSIAAAEFHCPMPAAEWRRLFGAIPGGRSRVLLVNELHLAALSRSWLTDLLAGLTLTDTVGREWGYLKTDYRLHDPRTQADSGDLRLVSREADDGWTMNRADRAGLLLIRGVKDLLKVVLEPGEAATQHSEPGPGHTQSLRRNRR